MSRNTAEIVVDTLAEWGVDVVFGLPGCNGVGRKPRAELLRGWKPNPSGCPWL